MPSSSETDPTRKVVKRKQNLQRPPNRRFGPDRQYRHLDRQWSKKTVDKIAGKPAIDPLYSQHVPSLVDHDPRDPYHPAHEVSLTAKDLWADLQEFDKPTVEQITQDVRKDLRALGKQFDTITLLPIHAPEENENTSTQENKQDIVKGGEHLVLRVKEDPSLVVKIKYILPYEEDIEAVVPQNKLYRNLLRLKGFPDTLPEIYASKSHRIKSSTQKYAILYQERINTDYDIDEVIAGIIEGDTALYRFGGENGALKSITDEGIPLEGDFRRGSNYMLHVKKEGNRIVEAHEAFIDDLFMQPKDILTIGNLLRIQNIMVDSGATKEDQRQIGTCILDLLKIQKKYAETERDKQAVNNLIDGLHIEDIVPKIELTKPHIIFQRNGGPNTATVA